ncbi:MAG: TonB-dependent receptor, partial [Paraglaciecola sp.]|nr:TonB-dependent receptor [Paraglaciecola sp.]
YEAGIKSSQLGGDLFISSAVYYNDASTWQEISLLTADDGTVLSTVLINSNAAITSKGAEFEAIYKINEALSLTAGFGYQDAVYDKNDYSEDISFAGNKVKMIPKWDSVISTTYQWNDGWYVRVQWRSLGKTALTADNAIFRKSLNLIDASMGYKQDNWSVRLYIDNMTNKRYAAGQAYQNFMLGTDSLYYAPLAKPRTIGLKVSFKL